ncbi:hypothetical protein [Flaviaesturariibacter terrae]
MEKIEKVRQPQTERPSNLPQQDSRNSTVLVRTIDQEILALQEKARRFQRHYPTGGYQGL